MNAEAQPKSLASYEFIALCVVGLLCFCNIAIFYGFYNYLQGLGIPAAWRGPLLALEPLTALALRPWLSAALNLSNCTRAMRIGVCLVILALASYPVATALPVLALVRILHGAGYVLLLSGLITTFTHILPQGRVAQGFGILSLASLLPSALMPPFVEAVTPFLPGPGYAYAVAAPLMVPALLLLAPLGRKTRALAAALPQEHSQRPAWAEVRANLRLPGVAALILGQLGLLTGHTIVYFFIKSWSLALGTGNPGLFFTCANVATIALRVLGMRHLDKLNPGRTTGLALLFLAVLVPCFTLAGSQTVLNVMAVFYGLALGLGMPLFNAAMFHVSPKRLRGLNTNLLLVAMDAGFILGPMIGGWVLAAGLSQQSLFVMSGAILLMAALTVLPVGRLTSAEKDV
ncbi:MAG: MFS transporter [Humidesulfovibrio sp.]|nr:MFS transporter [Humidesulfovibrio sp.]